ncbi:MAG: hypothetical protein ISN29_03560 [Gammaproteobacteria bacterium AqS3]|nr:hypothetical protein [Gammaproteobacteria bacterium AqS3]
MLSGRSPSILLLLPLFFAGQISQGASFPEIVLSETGLEIPEGGEGIIAMTLSRKPSDPVEVTWSYDDELLRIHEEDQVVNRAVFSDRGGAWKIPQYFRIEARANTKVGHAFTTLTARAKSGDADFDDLTASVSLKILDNDGVIMRVTPKQVSLTEGGAAKTFEVKLSGVPDRELTVSISSDDSGAAKVSPEKLTFEMGLARSISKTSGGSVIGYHETSYLLSREVTVTPITDRDKNNETVTILFEGSAKVLSNPEESVTVKVYDDDQDYLIFSKPRLSIAEGGSESFRVRLSRRPADSVRVGLSAPAGSLALGGRGALTFTSANWSVNQTVGVRAPQDDDSNDENEELSFKVSGGVYDGTQQKMRVEIRDDDSPGLALSSSRVTVAEGGEETFTVRLATRPTANVQLTLGRPENADISANADFSENRNTLTFTPDNWSQAQRVTVSAASDADAINDFGAIPIDSEGGEYSGIRGAVQVSVTENQSAGFALRPDVLSLTEGGPSKSFTVALTSEPAKRVRVELKSSDRTAVRVKPRRLVFRPSDWSEKQTVRVSPMADDDAEDERARVELTASGADYSDLTANVLVRVKDSDSKMPEAGQTEETAAVNRIEGERRRADQSVAPGASTVGPILEERAHRVIRNVGLIVTLVEDCDNWILTVRLAGKPTDLVEVELSSSIPGAALINPTALVFAASNWSEEQTAVIRPARDLADDVERVHVRLRASGAPEYENISTSAPLLLGDKKWGACPNAILEQMLCVLWALAWLLLILVLLILIQTVRQFFPGKKTNQSLDSEKPTAAERI